MRDVVQCSDMPQLKLDWMNEWMKISVSTLYNFKEMRRQKGRSLWSYNLRPVLVSTAWKLPSWLRVLLGTIMQYILVVSLFVLFKDGTVLATSRYLLKKFQHMSINEPLQGKVALSQSFKKKLYMYWYVITTMRSTMGQNGESHIY